MIKIKGDIEAFKKSVVDFIEKSCFDRSNPDCFLEFAKRRHVSIAEDITFEVRVLVDKDSKAVEMVSVEPTTAIFDKKGVWSPADTYSLFLSFLKGNGIVSPKSTGEAVLNKLFSELVAKGFDASLFEVYVKTPEELIAEHQEEFDYVVRDYQTWVNRWSWADEWEASIAERGIYNADGARILKRLDDIFGEEDASIVKPLFFKQIKPNDDKNPFL